MSGKYEKKNNGKKSIALLLALMLLVGCIAGGTVAWLMTKTDPVVNTFVAGEIGELTLIETDTDPNEEGMQHEYLVIPGAPITKDPVVNYIPTGTNDVAVYVFVEVGAAYWDSTANRFSIGEPPHDMYFDVDTAWEKITVNNKTVFVIKLAAGASLTNQKIIKDNKIFVDQGITIENIDEVVSYADGLTFKVYAIQQAGFNTVQDAWNAVSR